VLCPIELRGQIRPFQNTKKRPIGDAFNTSIIQE